MKYFVQVETNGMFQANHTLFDWITVSPKNNRLAIKHANELKLVLGEGETIREYDIQADHYFISPKNPTHAHDIGSDSSQVFNLQSAKWCYDFILKNPKWRLSLQTHKILGVE